MNSRSLSSLCRRALAMALTTAGVHGSSFAADIDIYGIQGTSSASNVLFFIDNTANWSTQEQSWVPMDSWNKCKSLDEKSVIECQDAIKAIFYPKGGDAEKKKISLPWDPGWKNSDATYWNSNKLPQGVIEARVLKMVLNALACNATKPLPVNVGLSMFNDAGSVRKPKQKNGGGDLPAFIYHAVQPLDSASCASLLTKLDAIDKNVNEPVYKVPASADYSSIFYEAFKYFGGYTHPALASTTDDRAGPVGATAYGNVRFSMPNALDDPAAFDPAGSGRYKSPISASGACGKNYLVLIGNGYPKPEPKDGTSPTKFDGLAGDAQPKYDYTKTPVNTDILAAPYYADDWSYFLANTDVSDVAGIQPVFTYAVNVYNAKWDPDQAKLLKSIAKYGGVGGSAYIEVGGDLYKLVKAFEGILYQVAAESSVFAATTLPVSTTTQGTYLNQVFVGMFRPDAQASPRWLGNLKQYQLGFDETGVLQLQDLNQINAVLPGTPDGGGGFFSPLAQSFWPPNKSDLTKKSVFFTNRPSGTVNPESDSPDGAIVEKGGVALWLREANMTSSAGRAVYTLPADPSSAKGELLSKYSFTTSTSGLDSGTVAWVRGDANVPDGFGAESFVGSYLDSGVLKNALVRPSIHGDVLHSRPVAINYGGDNVVVFYGSNDGFLRAVDGKKTTGGNELWSFLAPEHFPLLKRLRAGYPRLHLPETDSSGNTLPADPGDPPATATKDYAFDGPLGAYVRYATGGTSVKEAIIYASVRRGGQFVYAFDVTFPNAPRFKWKVKQGESAGFGSLAQTWSMAKPIVYAATSGDPPVVVAMGGGYDPVEDSLSASSSKGNSIFFIDGRTGQLLKEVNQFADKTTLRYSVPSDVTVVDLDGDGIPDRAYFVDVRGNLYRIDLPKVTRASSQNILNTTTWNSTVVTKIAELSGKAFYAPDVVVTNEFVAVLVGTGDREKPLLTSKKSGSLPKVDGVPTEAFFLVKDTKAGEPPRSLVTVEDLAHIAKVVINEDPKSPAYKSTSIVEVTGSSGYENGCYITLASDGEKVVNAPATIAGVSYFGTNRPTPPSKTSLVCKPNLGEAYAYKFPLFCKVPTRTKLNTGGMPPSPTTGIVTIDVGGKPTQVPFVIGGGAGASPFSPEQPKPDVSAARKRTFWYIDNANR